jgi:hypothetical protein
MNLYNKINNYQILIVNLIVQKIKKRTLIIKQLLLQLLVEQIKYLV